jgi:hypothetical protein
VPRLWVVWLCWCCMVLLGEVLLCGWLSGVTAVCQLSLDANLSPGEWKLPGFDSSSLRFSARSSSEQLRS